MNERLSGFEFRAELGRGSMGHVLLARRLPQGDLVAVKRLGDAARLGGSQQARLRREATALSRLHHPHVVRLLDLVQTGEELLLVLEYIDGPSLAELQHRQAVSRPDALAVLSQIQSGLQHAHSVGVLHRDIKPSNVLVSKAGRCTIADFGLARLDDIAPIRTWVTRPGMPIGTAPYMSPEAAGGVVDIDVRSDVYSLGVLSYELLLGRLPFPAEMGIVGLINAHACQQVPRPRSIDESFPNQVEEVLLWSLEKDRDNRPQAAEVLWEALNDAASGVWPWWPEEADLEVLGRSAFPADEPLASEMSPSALEHLWPWNDLDLRRIEPSLPELKKPSRTTEAPWWALLGVVLALSTFLLLRAFAG